jgi:hypothetical protein
LVVNCGYYYKAAIWGYCTDRTTRELLTTPVRSVTALAEPCIEPEIVFGLDNLLGNHYCGESTPRRNRELRWSATLRMFQAIATQNQTSYGFPIIQHGQLPHKNCVGFWLRDPLVRHQLW